MTENQEKQMMSMLTKCVNGIQRLEEGYKRLEGDVTEMKGDIVEMKGDISELKQGQARLEKETQLINKGITILTTDSMQTRIRVGVLEDKVELSN